MISVSPAVDKLRRERTSGPRYVERVIAPKPSPGRRGKQTAAVTPATYKDLTHKTPQAALLARLKKTSTKQGSPGLAHDISPTLGAVTVAKMAAAVRKAEAEAELMQKLSAQHKAKVDAMGGGIGKQNPYARAHL